MLKKVMLYLMILLTAGRLIAIGYRLSINPQQLPVAVYVSSGLLVLAGLALICKWIIKSIRKRELSLYYLLTIICIAFNLFYLKLFSLTEVAPVDLLIIGTFMDLLVSVTLIVLTAKERKYVKIPVQSGQNK